MSILYKDYYEPSTLTDIEEDIKQNLEFLLMDEIKTTAYIHFVEGINEAERISKELEEKEKNEEEERLRREQEKRERRAREEAEERERKEQEQPKTFTNSIGMKFTLIPAGEFEMGSEEYKDGTCLAPTPIISSARPSYRSKNPVFTENFYTMPLLPYQEAAGQRRDHQATSSGDCST